jgi:quercetin dioxygenase-like cupin family protein
MTPSNEIDRSRVTSTAAGPVLREHALLQLWGDAESGFVNDWVYVSSERLYQIVLSMPPGHGFTHSVQNRTIFGADELYYVLRGRLLLCNPETGEVVPLEEGEAAWFGPDTWHHGFSADDSDVRVLEFFAPPPAAGMSQAYARTRPFLSEPIYIRERPADRPTIMRVGRDDVLWRVEGQSQELLIGLLLSTDRITVAQAELVPGAQTAARSHDGDLGLYVVEGSLGVSLGGSSWRLAQGDGFFVPAGFSYTFANDGAVSASCVFAVAPGYASPVSQA